MFADWLKNILSKWSLDLFFLEYSDLLNNSDAQTSWQMKCHFCKLNHFIYKCEGFQALSLDKKRRFVLCDNMCLSCLWVSHFAKDCKRKVICDICKQIHPTLLHEEQFKAKEEKASTALYCKRANNSNHTSMIILVWLSRVKAESPEILVYALLDSLNSNTFIDQDVCKKINADSEPVRLKLSTMTNRNSIVKSQEYIPLEKNSIPTRKTAETWDRLLSIAKHMPDELDCPVRFLIGYDCAGALKPKKVVIGEDHDPFAVKKTKLV